MKDLTDRLQEIFDRYETAEEELAEGATDQNLRDVRTQAYFFALRDALIEIGAEVQDIRTRLNEGTSSDAH